MTFLFVIIRSILNSIFGHLGSMSSLNAIWKQEVSLKKIIVEGYRAVGSLNDRTFCCCSSSSLISVNGMTYKSAIKRPIKIRTHDVTDNKIITGQALKFYVGPSQATKPCNNLSP